MFIDNTIWEFMKEYKEEFPDDKLNIIINKYKMINTQFRLEYINGLVLLTGINGNPTEITIPPFVFGIVTDASISYTSKIIEWPRSLSKITFKRPVTNLFYNGERISCSHNGLFKLRGRQKVQIVGFDDKYCVHLSRLLNFCESEQIEFIGYKKSDKVTHIGAMVHSCPNLIQFRFPDSFTFNTAHPFDASELFIDCISLQIVDFNRLDLNNTNAFTFIKKMPNATKLDFEYAASKLFRHCRNLKVVKIRRDTDVRIVDGLKQAGIDKIIYCESRLNQ